MTERLAAHELIAFVGTTSFEKARAFYGEALGLPLLSEDGFALVFDAHGTKLRVTLVNQVTPAAYTVLGWQVDDIAAAVRELEAAGVKFQHYAGLPQDELGIWRAPGGARVAWFKDPDGNTLSVTQL